VLRAATAGDAEPLAAFLGEVELWGWLLQRLRVRGQGRRVVARGVDRGAALSRRGRARSAKAAPAVRYSFLSLWLLGTEHPLYHVSRLPERDPGYAWYVRVPDVAAFLTVVTPALERRLAASPCAGHTGTLTLGFYSDGVRLTL